MGQREDPDRNRKAEVQRLRRRVSRLKGRLSGPKRHRGDREEFRALCDLASDFVFRGVLEPDGTASLEWIRGDSTTQWGFRAEDITGPGGWKKVIHSDDRAAARRLMEAVRSGGKAEDHLRAVTKGGEMRWLDVSMSPLRHGGQEGAKAVLGTVTDITDSRPTEEALRRSEAKYREIAETVEELIYRADPQTLEPLFVNGAVEKFYGYTVEVWLNSPGLWKEHIHPEDRERVEDALREARENKTPGRLEYRITRRDGAVRWVEDRFTWEKDRYGQVVAMDGVMYDLTERKTAQEKLQRNEERFRRLFEAVPEQILVHDEEGTILFANEVAARRLERPVEGLVGKDLSEIVSAENVSPIRDHVAEAQAEGRTSFETTYVTATGTRIEAVVSEARIQFEGQAAVLSVARDVTRQRNMQETLRASERRYRTLAENTPDIHYSMCADGTLTYIGPQVERYGYRPDDFLGQNVLDVIVSEDKQTVKDELAQTLRTGRTSPSTFRVRDARGEVHWFEERSSLTRDDSGEITGLSGVLRDITERKRAEESLRESEQRFRHIFKQAAVGIAQVAPNGVIRQVNEAFCRMVGYPEDELTGMTFQDITHPDDLEADIDHVQRLLEGDISRYSMEKRYLAKSGDIVWAILCVGLVRDEDGEPDYFVSVVQQITERKRAQKALQESEQRYRAITEKSHDGIFIYRGDRFLYVNDTLCRIMGYSKEELYDAYVWDMVHPDDRDRLKEIGRKRARGKEVPDTYEARALTESGQVLHLEFAVTPIVYDGEYAALGSVRDITDRREAERQIRESEQMFRSLAEESPNMVFINEAEGFAYVNKRCEEILGYTREELRSRDFDWLTLVAAEDRDRVASKFEQHMNGNEVEPYGCALVTRDGERIDVLVSTCLIQHSGREAVLGIVTDISELKRTQRELESHREELRVLAKKRCMAEERERRRIAGGLHDDVSQLLTSCHIRLEKAKESHASGELAETLEEVLEDLESAVEKTQSLTFELSSPLLHELGLAEAVEELAEKTLEGHGIICDFHYAGQPLSLSEEMSVTLFRATQELLMNVIKHADARSVTVSLSRQEGHVHLSVKDDGDGFDTDMLQPRPTRSGGFGLFGIMERLEHLGGSVEVTSESGNGTTVTLIGPLKRNGEVDEGGNR